MSISKERLLRSHIKNLVAVANIDGIFHRNELKFLYSLSENYGLTPDDIDKIIEEIDNVNPTVPEDDKTKTFQLIDLVKMMRADNVMRREEMLFCKSVCKSFGYFEELIDKIIERLDDNQIEGPYFEELMDEANSFKIDD